MNLGENLDIDNQELITGRTCILAQSGGGKSYGMGVICEELCRENIGFAVIDTEGEYSSLKQKFNVLWLGTDSRCDTNIESVDYESFIQRAIEDNMPVIFDVSEVVNLNSTVDSICNAFYKVAGDLKTPYLLIIEEADKFAPQKGGKVLGSLNEIARRGRKRGLGLMVASQRPAFINKDILSQCNNQFIGKLTVKNDLDAVRQFFNNREDLMKLPDLNYDFFAMGSIVKGKDALFKFKERITKHGGLTPSIKPKKSKGITEFLSEMKKETFIEKEAISSTITPEKAGEIALSHAKKKFGFFGKSLESVSELKTNLIPVIEAEVEVKKKNLVGKPKLESYKILFDAVNGFIINNRFDAFEDTKKLIELDNYAYQVLKSLKKKNKTQFELESEIKGVNVESALKLLRDKELVVASGKVSRSNLYSSHYNGGFYDIEDLASDEYSTEKIKAGSEEKPKYSAEDLKKILKTIGNDISVKTRFIYLPVYIATLRNNSKTRTIKINGITGKII